jgi:hypothetical protein
MRTPAKPHLNHGLFINYPEKEPGRVLFVGIGKMYTDFAIGCQEQIDTD